MNVTNPDYYRREGGVETIDLIRSWYSNDAEFARFCIATAMIYEDRAGCKGPPEIDHKKAQWFRQMSRHVLKDTPDPRESTIDG